MKFLTPNWPAPANVKAFTTTRVGWGEPGCRAWQPEALEKLVGLLALPDTPIWLKQHHGTTVVDALPTARGVAADASVSNRSNHICLIETADCLPVLICNRQGTHVSAVHAGWRGLANGIVEATVASLKLPPDELLVWLGPAIGPSKFEVGRDVYEAFVNQHSAAAACFKPINDEKWLANLYELARLRLQLLSITTIYGGDYCTHSQTDLFYSYRRDGAGTGRMASVIWFTLPPLSP